MKGIPAALTLFLARDNHETRPIVSSKIGRQNLPPVPAELSRLKKNRRRWNDVIGTTRSSVYRKRNMAAYLSTSSDNVMGDDDHQSAANVLPQKKKTIVLATTFNLVKAIAGSGILALPSGVAAMSDFQSRLVPSLVIMASLGALSAYTFVLYGRVLSVHQSQSLGELWRKEKGKSAWMISLATMAFCFGGALSYSILIGDMFEALAHSAGLSGIFLARPFWILLLSSTVLFPLCNLDSLLSLAPLSIVGVVAVAITTCFLGWRCPQFNSMSPYALSGGLLSKISSTMAPKFNTYQSPLFSPPTTILIGMAASAYLGHFSAPSFYQSLNKANPNKANSDTDNQSSSEGIKNYKIVSWLGFGVATLLNCLVMTFGFLTFGGSSSGMILNNYSFKDSGAAICRLLMAICVLGGFPFLVGGVVDEFLQLRGKKQEGEALRKTRKMTTSVTLSVLTGLSLIMKNAGFVIGFSGAVMGSCIVYIFPALLFLSNSGKKLESGSRSWSQKLERLGCRLVVGFGACVALLGGCVSVASTYFPHLLK